MVDRIYVDTNIFIDLLDATRPFAKDTSNIIRTMITNGTLLYINSDTVTNTFYVLSKQKKYTQKELLGLMRKSVSIFMIVSVEDEEVTDAITLCEDENTTFEDYEDALQYVCAKKADVALILTNDRGFMSKDIEVKSTNELSLD